MEFLARPAAAAVLALAAGATLAVQPVTAPVPPVVAAAVEMVALPSWLGWVSDGTDVLTAQIGAIANGLRDEIENPVPILTVAVRNQIGNAQTAGSALVDTVQVLATGLVSVPELLLNAAFDVIANPLAIPAVLIGLVSTVLSTATAAVGPLGAAVVSVVNNTVNRAVGVAGAVAGNLAPIGAALFNVPVAIGNALVSAAAAVVGSLVTLNPFSVIGAVGDGLVGVEAASFNAAAGVATAVGNLRSAVRVAMAYPLPAAALPAAAKSAAAQTVPAAASRSAARPVQAPRSDVLRLPSAAAKAAQPAAAGTATTRRTPDRPAKAAAARAARS